MKKFIISTVILIIFAAAVFMLGWLEFFVPINSVGVLVSKTGGIHTEVIKAGNFTWAWERLIPTNSKIRIFSVVAKNYTNSISGDLPSADIYKNMLEGNPNFSYNFSVDIEMGLKADSLPSYIAASGVEEQASLDSFMSKQAEKIARDTIEYVLQESIDNPDFVMQVSLSDEKLIEAIYASGTYNNLDIISIHINNVSIPDITMYNYAKNTYNAYQNAVQASLDGVFELQGFEASQDYLELERLSRLGRVLADYPQLIDYMAVTNGNLDFDLPNDIPQIRNEN